MRKLPAPGPVALRAAAGAEVNTGVRETSPNRGRWIDVYAHAAGIDPGEPWCAAWAFYRLWAAAGRPADYRLPCGFPRTGYTPLMAQWAREHDLWIGTPHRRELARRGDLVLYWFENMGRIAHVGIVVAVDGVGFRTVEGNTSAGGGREGDGVYRRWHDWDAMHPKSGFARIPW